jgi:DNA repair protein RecN (Recombination protein N)
MLSFLSVKSYAVIDTVDLELQSGLSVMTGETGAGKSILVDALSLVLGDRADAAAVRPGAERAEISAQFDCEETSPALAWLREQGLEDGTECVLRRSLSRDGRSRAFINGQAVNVQALRNLGNLLIDIHGQHAHQSLLTSAAQRAILDAQGGHAPLAANVTDRFSAWRQQAEDLDARRLGGQRRDADLELYGLQLRELDELALEAGELERLDAEHRRLAGTDRLLQGLASALAQLSDDDIQSAYGLVAAARQEIERLGELDDALLAPAKLLADAEIGLSEAVSELRHYRDRIDADPERLATVEARLAKIRALARRHRVTPGELLPLRASLAEQCKALEHGGESLEQLERALEAARKTYFATARELSAARSQSAETLAIQVTAQLAELGLPHGRFRIALSAKPDAQADGTGLENIEFEVSLNPGQPFGPISRVASGGELSRLSLALEVVSAGATQVPTLIFDEVDSGIGGGVAEIVGRRLREIAQDRQVLCVTHLPQVASQGRHHYRVLKRTDGHNTQTDVLPLTAEDRIEELSRMLGGIEVTERARAHAAEMIARGAQSSA